MTRTCSLRCGRMRSDWHVRRARTSNGTTPPRTSTRHGPGATVGPVAHAGSSAGSVRRWPADRRASGRFDPEPSEEIADGRNLEPSSGTRRAPPRSTAKAVAPAEPCEDVLNLVERRLRRTYQPAVTHKGVRARTDVVGAEPGEANPLGLRHGPIPARSHDQWSQASISAQRGSGTR